MNGNTSRREFLVSAGVVAAGSLLASCTAARQAGRASPGRRPNVVLIITDDQGYGDLGFHGNEKIRTPNLDGLAAQSVRFGRFYVSPVCAPTRACLMTGRYNHRTGAIDTYLGRAMMHPDEVTLAEVLGGAGYRTGLFGKWHLGDNYPMRPQDQGFEEVLMHRGGGMVQPGDPPGSRYMDPILQHNGVEKVFKGYCTDVFADAAIGFIERNRGEPFFCYLATNAPHTPLEVPEDWVRPYREAGLDETTAKIYAMCENIDRCVGRVLAKLEELKLAEETIVLFMHDNGAQQVRYNTGLRGTKGTVYEGGIRSPLFIRYPAKLAPREVKTVAAHIDLMPTLLELCGVSRPREVAMDGLSLAPLLGGGEAGARFDRPIFLQWHRGDEPVMYNNCAVVMDRYKLVNGKELYDLQADPAEAKNLAAQHAEKVAELRAAYEAWFADVNREKRYVPPRIVLGSAHENPSVLTRQDWRGPRAGWSANSLGYWEVEFERAGTYAIEFRFDALRVPAKVQFIFGDMVLTQEARAGDTSCTFRDAKIRGGAGRLEGQIVLPERTIGVNYVDVRRL